MADNQTDSAAAIPACTTPKEQVAALRAPNPPPCAIMDDPIRRARTSLSASAPTAARPSKRKTKPSASLQTLLTFSRFDCLVMGLLFGLVAALILQATAAHHILQSSTERWNGMKLSSNDIKGLFFTGSLLTGAAFGGLASRRMTPP